MKLKLFATTCAATMLVACQQNKSADISGHLQGFENDTIYMQAVSIKNGQGFYVDTVVVQPDGSFSINLKNNVELNNIYLIKSDETSIARIANFLYLPGKAVEVNGSIGDITISGEDDFYADCNELWNKVETFIVKSDSLGSESMKLIATGASQDSVMAKYMPLLDEQLSQFLDAQMGYVRQNLDKDVALYAMLPLPTDSVNVVMPQLSESVKSGKLADVYQSLAERCKNEMLRNQAIESLKEGNEAPDFTLKDIDGKDFKLSSLRGKYVVLDFWGSWCGWCIKGIPDMKASYAKHNGKVEFVGIDCNDTEQDWKDAVKEHEMPWIHVRNEGNPDVAVMYGIEGYPTKIIVDKEGKIVKKIVGEDPAFYKFLDELLK